MKLYDLEIMGFLLLHLHFLWHRSINISCEKVNRTEPWQMPLSTYCNGYIERIYQNFKTLRATAGQSV